MRSFGLLLALAGLSFADVYSDFNTAIVTFNSQVTLWNSGPTGLVDFNSDISTFNTAVDSFNSATTGNYAEVTPVAFYTGVSIYPGSSPAIETFDTAVTTFNTSVINFNLGSLDLPDFASNVATFDSAVSTFNSEGADPPVSLEASLPTYSQESLVTNPGTSTPEPSSVLLMGLGLAVGWFSKRRDLRN